MTTPRLTLTANPGDLRAELALNDTRDRVVLTVRVARDGEEVVWLAFDVADVGRLEATLREMRAAIGGEPCG